MLEFHDCVLLYSTLESHFKLLKIVMFIQMSMSNIFDALICKNVDLSISMKPADANRVQDGDSSKTSIYRNLSYTR